MGTADAAPASCFVAATAAAGAVLMRSLKDLFQPNAISAATTANARSSRIADVYACS